MHPLAILRIQYGESPRKAFSTCSSHLCVVRLCFGSAIDLSTARKSLLQGPPFQTRAEPTDLQPEERRGQGCPAESTVRGESFLIAVTFESPAWVLSYHLNPEKLTAAFCRDSSWCEIGPSLFLWRKLSIGYTHWFFLIRYNFFLFLIVLNIHILKNYIDSCSGSQRLNAVFLHLHPHCVNSVPAHVIGFGKKEKAAVEGTGPANPRAACLFFQIVLAIKDHLREL